MSNSNLTGLSRLIVRRNENPRHISSVRLESKASHTYRSEINIKIDEVIHTEHLHVQCVPKIHYSESKLSVDGKVTRSSQNVEYTTQHIPSKHVHIQTHRRRQRTFTSEVQVNLPPKLTEVHHSHAIHVPATSYSDRAVISYSDEENTLNNDDFSEISAKPLTMSTPLPSRRLSERNPRVFDEDSQSYLYEFDSLESWFSKDSTISEDHVTDFCIPKYQNEVLILGLNSKRKRYACTGNTSNLLKGILKKRTQ
ncbi:uncharacterized protein [Argopecten irradians]|uniref:uncharacterized protein n=1 Tax=Argopecten irradians TaxID=31199 RepID=UPI003712ED8F